MLLHLVDGTENNPASNYRTVRRELDAYGGGLPEKRELVALNKCDALSNQLIKDIKRSLEDETEKPVFVTSSIAGTGLNEVLRRLVSEVARHRADEECLQ